MSLFEQYNVTPEEMGIQDKKVFEEKQEELMPLFLAHAMATVAARESFHACISWKGGRTKTEFYKEYQRLKYKNLDDEREKEKTKAAFLFALMGDSYLEWKRQEQEAVEEAYERALQEDLDPSGLE
jgi:hypothetical protein